MPSPIAWPRVRISSCAALAFAILWFVTAPSSAVAGGSGIWLDVPFIAQPENGCGAASAAMVMQYWEHSSHREHSSRSDVQTIQDALYSKEDRGILASAMQNYLQDSGYRTFAIRAQWQDLQENLAKGRPLIISLAPAGKRHPLHYVVVAGIESDAGAIFVNDPAQRKLLRIARTDFEREWSDAGNWTLLALPN